MHEICGSAVDHGWAMELERRKGGGWQQRGGRLRSGVRDGERGERWAGEGARGIEGARTPLSYTWSQTPSALSNGAVRDAATAVTSSPPRRPRPPSQSDVIDAPTLCSGFRTHSYSEPRTAGRTFPTVGVYSLVGLRRTRMFQETTNRQTITTERWPTRSAITVPSPHRRSDPPRWDTDCPGIGGLEVEEGDEGFEVAGAKSKHQQASNKYRLSNYGWLSLC